MKRIALTILVTVVATQAECFVSAQSYSKPTKAGVGIEKQDVRIVMSQILSCPAWDEVEKGDVKTKSKIMKSLALISENDIV